MDVIIASDPDPEIARTQHYLLGDATEYVRAAYEASGTHLPIAIITRLAEWENIRRDLNSSSGDMNTKLHQARVQVENAPSSVVLEDERTRLLTLFDSLGYGFSENGLEATPDSI